MYLRDFFNNQVVALPKHRPHADLELFLIQIFRGYVDLVKTLDPRCHLCRQITGAIPDIEQLGRWIVGAVRQYHKGQPERAYDSLRSGANFVLPRLRDLYSVNIGGDEIGPLYRMASIPPNSLSKDRIFHVPFDLRHLIGRHRYGILGFPCLYLGGSLRLCQTECRVLDADLRVMAIAEFAPRHALKVLDLGYRPSALADTAGGAAMRPSGSNPGIESLIVNYAVCWPLMAAASVHVLHRGANFYAEYIVPQLLLQWLVQETDCDGIRFFSTRYVPRPTAIRATANYVFPARNPGDSRTGHCQQLKNLFEFTDPTIWTSTTGGADLIRECQDNEGILAALPKSRMP